MFTTSKPLPTRRFLAAALTAGAAVTGVAAALAPAAANAATPAQHAVHASVHPDGLVAVQSCGSVSGTIAFNPGLAKGLHTQSAALNATVDNCSSSFTGAESGQGTLSAVLSGNASVTSQGLTGTYVISWPAGAGLNPSTGNISITGPNQNVITLSGTGTGGAYAGLPVSTAFFVSGHTGLGTKAHRITAESLVNTLPLRVVENLG